MCRLSLTALNKLNRAMSDRARVYSYSIPGVGCFVGETRLLGPHSRLLNSHKMTCRGEAILIAKRIMTPATVSTFKLIHATGLVNFSWEQQPLGMKVVLGHFSWDKFAPSPFFPARVGGYGSAPAYFVHEAPAIASHPALVRYTSLSRTA